MCGVKHCALAQSSTPNFGVKLGNVVLQKDPLDKDLYYCAKAQF